MIFSHTFNPVPESDLTAQKRSSSTASTDVCDCGRHNILITELIVLIVSNSLPTLHFKSLLTLCNGACSTGLSEAVALTHWTAETYIHKSLSCCGQGGTSRQHHPHPSSQQFLHFPEQQAATTGCGLVWFSVKQHNSERLSLCLSYK